MEHQVKLKNASTKLLILNAPTSSGKTLASLLKIIESGKNSIFIYPTNELIYDQAGQIATLLKALGKDATVIPILNSEQGISEANLQADVVMLIINGKTLEVLSEEMSVRTKGEVLDRLLRNALKKRVILLSTPDFLYVWLKAQYKRSGYLYKFLPTFQELVIDEFHLYQGISFANLIFILWRLRNIFEHVIISSATLGDTLEITKELFGSDGCEIIEATPSVQGRIVRHLTDLEITHSPRILAEEDIEFVCSRVTAYYERFKSCNSQVKVLVIVNSVVFADSIFQELRGRLSEDSVSAIHGLIPQEKRRLTDVTIGTSAVEVGIDFDAASVIFEARDAPAFLQRLGRGGRHGGCEATGIIPTQSYESLEKALQKEEFSYQEFSSIIITSLGYLPSYSSFIRSTQAELLLGGFLYDLTKRLEGWCDKQRVEELLGSLSWCPSIVPKKPLSLESYTKLKALSNEGFRGSLNSIPAYFREYDAFVPVCLADLRKLNFRYFPDSKDAESWIPQPIPKELRGGHLLVVFNVGLQYKDIRILAPQIQPQKVWVLREDSFGVDARDEDLEKEVKKLLSGRVAYRTLGKLDWRFQGLPGVSNNEWVIIGADALLTEFVNKGKHALGNEP